MKSTFARRKRKFCSFTPAEYSLCSQLRLVCKPLACNNFSHLHTLLQFHLLSRNMCRMHCNSLLTIYPDLSLIVLSSSLYLTVQLELQLASPIAISSDQSTTRLAVVQELILTNEHLQFAGL